jgi:hypothetical protein
MEEQRTHTLAAETRESLSSAVMEGWEQKKRVYQESVQKA